ncbi:MAG: tripartite tricarboxylate transporter TctB family protein [Kiloniellaceae bacterium]
MTKDAWIGAVFLAFAVVYWIAADGIRISPLDGPVGAAGLPKSLAYTLGGLAILLIVRSFLLKRFAATPAAKPAAEADDEGGETKSPMHRHLRALGMLALGVGYLLIVPYLGYTLSITGLALAVSLYIGARFGAKTLAVAGIGGVFFYLLFVQFLKIPLPPGVWPSLLQSLQG